MALDLHELANRPGAGSAKKALVENGAWDENRGLPERIFEVRVEYTVNRTDCEVVHVVARSKNEAEEKAVERITNNCDDYIEVTFSMAADVEASQ
jgi:hypothetical protein